MNKEIFIKIPYEVTPASRPRVTKYGTFYSKNYTAFREVVSKWLSEKKVMNKLEGAIKAQVLFYMKTPKSWSKKKTEKAHEKYHISNKDIDNFQKSIFDILQGIYYDDDSQIVSVNAEKRWHKNEGHILIVLKELELSEQL